MRRRNNIRRYAYPQSSIPSSSIPNSSIPGMMRVSPHYTNETLDKGAKIEHKEHPEFTIEQARMIAKDHLDKNWYYYDGGN